MNLMSIELEKLNLGTFKLLPEGPDFYLSSTHSSERRKINPNQKEFIEAFAKGLTIEQVVSGCIKHDIHISFRELYKTVFILYELNLITNHKIKHYFEEVEEGKLTLAEAPIGEENRMKKWNTKSILSFPFFRNLKKDVAEKFVEAAELMEVAERSLVVKFGDVERHMYVLLEGTASIYRVTEKNRRQLITTVPAGSVFGEGAFLLGSARTADIITNTPAVLAKIKYDQAIFDPIIHATKVDALQVHFWILHGLLSSPLFHGVPCETMDRFARSGKVLNVRQNTLLTEQGKKGDSFFVIIQGEVNIHQNGREVKTLKSGDIFGEVALLMSEGTRTASAVAARDCMLLQVSKNEFFEVLSRNLILAKDIEDIAHKRYNSASSRYF